MFLLFGFGIWALLIELAIFITLVVLVEVGFYFWSSILCLASLVSLHFVLKLPLLNYFKEKPSYLAALLAVSLVCGIIWSFVKWISFLYKFKEVREEELAAFRELRARDDAQLKSEEEMRHAYKESPQQAEFDFLNRKDYKNTPLSQAPTYKQYKADIVAWIIFWIPSLIGTLFDDFVRRMVEWIANRFKAIYQHLSHKIVGNFQNPKMEP